jgi:hypothetical protein
MPNSNAAAGWAKGASLKHAKTLEEVCAVKVNNAETCPSAVVGTHQELNHLEYLLLRFFDTKLVANGASRVDGT